MVSWQELTLEEVQHLLVPADVAQNPNNRFFSTYRPPEYWEGRWLLLAMMHHPDERGVVTVQLCSVDLEHLEGANPLTMTMAGIVGLNQSSIYGLASFLRKYAEHLPSVEEKGQSVFETIQDTDLDKYNLLPRVDDKYILEREYYLQVGDPLAHRKQEETVNISIVSLPHRAITFTKQKFSRYRRRIKFLQLTASDLTQPGFNPVRAYRLNRIDLNQQGLLELADILEDAVSPRGYKFKDE